MPQQPPRKLEMEPRKKSSFAPVIIIILLGLCGGGAWYMLTQRDGPISTQALSAKLPASGGQQSSAGSEAAGNAGTGRFSGGTESGSVMRAVPEMTRGNPPANEKAPESAMSQVMAGAGNSGHVFPESAVEPGKISSGTEFSSSASSLSPVSSGVSPAGAPAGGANAAGRDGAQSSQAQKKTDSGNIVEPPAGVRAPVLVTEAHSGRTGEQGTSGVAAQDPFSERERRIAAVEAAMHDKEPPAGNAPEGMPSRGMSMGGTLDGLDADEAGMDGAAAGSLAAEAAESGDSVITPRFVRSLARWMVDHYTPAAKKGGKGRVSASLSAANTAFGQSMSGLRYIGGNPTSGRAFVLSHAWSPGMLEALYRMYDEPFVLAMRDAAAKRSKGGLNAGQTADMFRAYAGQFRQLDAGLRGVAETADIDVRVGQLRKTDQEIAQARKELTGLVDSYERAVRQGNSPQADELRARMEKTSQRIQKAASARTRAERSLAAEIRRKAGADAPDDATLLYLAQWVERRDSGLESAAVAADLLGRMAKRFEAEAAAK